MKNIFILYMPTGNYEAMVHYQDTIRNRVAQDRIFKYIDSNLKNRLTGVFGSKPIAVWGSRSGDQNRSRYEKMQPGDNVLIIEGETIKLLGKVAAKTINQDLSHELWKNLKGDSVEGWDLIYFIANPLEIELPFSELKSLFGYKQEWALRGFTNISDDKLKSFYEQYDDLYSVLQRIKLGEKVEQKVEAKTDEVTTPTPEPDNFEYLPEELSDHIKMQWKLINLGVKAGSKVWIPKNNQAKIKEEYDFDNFEKEFTAGLDTQAKYVEQIDVVWKEEYRIDAAFEIENSTSIYSGLLRFADLKLVAPNTTYPLFIVAPRSKKNKVISQANRPSFKKIDFDKKVRFLSYETIDEIDQFFGESTSGVRPEILTAKSESIGSYN
jgi:hypothetical protein